MCKIYVGLEIQYIALIKYLYNHCALLYFVLHAGCHGQFGNNRKSSGLISRTAVVCFLALIAVSSKEET